LTSRGPVSSTARAARGGIETFEVADLSAGSPAWIPRGEAATARSIGRVDGAEDQRKVDDFIIFAMAAARQALDDANWIPRPRRQMR